MVVFQTDPCGITCIIVTYCAMFYADYVIVVHLVIPTMSDTLWGVFNVLVFNTIVFLMTASHLRAVLSDPGIVPLPTTSLDFSDIHSNKTPQNLTDGWTMCNKCEIYRPPRAHHCRICRRCIRRMDHHCPWINNCVGELNQKFFLQFLFYVGLASIFATTMVIVSWLLDPGVKGEGKHIKIQLKNIMQKLYGSILETNGVTFNCSFTKALRINSILLVIESFLFGLFVIAIGCDQLSAIFSDETAVEQMKKDGPRRNKSKMALLQEVFGRGHPLTWLCPVQFNSIKHSTAYTTNHV